MYCPYCAAAVDPSQSICQVCSQPIAGAPQQQAPPQGWQQPAAGQHAGQHAGQQGWPPQNPPDTPPQQNWQQQQQPQQAWQQQSQNAWQQPGGYQAPQPGWGMPPQSITATGAPSSVRLAAMLILAATGIGLLYTLYFFARYFSSYRSSFGFGFAQTFLFAIAWTLLVMFIWKGQNWARFAAGAFICYSILMTILSFSRFFSYSRAQNVSLIISFAISIVAAGLRGYACFLLFQPEANAFFTKR